MHKKLSLAQKQALIALRDARKKLHLTVRALAEAIGVSRQAISSYEHGEYPPRADVWKKMRKALKLPKDQTVETYWGRIAHIGKDKMYHKGDLCSIKGCENEPICGGLCRKHYQRVRYHKLVHGVIPDFSEAEKVGK